MPPSFLRSSEGTKNNVCDWLDLHFKLPCTRATCDHAGSISQPSYDIPQYCFRQHLLYAGASFLLLAKKRQGGEPPPVVLLLRPFPADRGVVRQADVIRGPCSLMLRGKTLFALLGFY